MNVKKTKKFKENRPENYHVHDKGGLDSSNSLSVCCEAFRHKTLSQRGAHQRARTATSSISCCPSRSREIAKIIIVLMALRFAAIPRGPAAPIMVSSVRIIKLETCSTRALESWSETQTLVQCKCTSLPGLFRPKLDNPGGWRQLLGSR